MANGIAGIAEARSEGSPILAMMFIWALTPEFSGGRAAAVV